MREYWVNVYDYVFSEGIWYGRPMATKEEAAKYKCLYRIHVRMK